MSSSQSKYSENSTSQKFPLRSIYTNNSTKDEEYIPNKQSNQFIWNDNPSFQEQKSSRYIKYLKDQNLQLKQQLDQERQLTSYQYEQDASPSYNNEFNQLQVSQLQLQLATLQEEFERYKAENNNQQKDSLLQIEQLLKEKQHYLSDKDKLKEENQQLNRQLVNYKQQDRSTSFEEQEKQLQLENDKLRDENTRNNNELKQIRSELEKALSEKAKIQQKINNLKTENQKLKKNAQEDTQQQPSTKMIKKRSISPKIENNTTKPKRSAKTTKEDENDIEELHHIKIRIIKKRSSTPKSDKMTLTLPNEFIVQPKGVNNKETSPSSKSGSKRSNKKRQEPNKPLQTSQQEKVAQQLSVKRRSLSPKPTTKKQDLISNKEKSATSTVTNKKRSLSPKPTTNSNLTASKRQDTTKKKRSTSPKDDNTINTNKNDQTTTSGAIKKRSISPKQEEQCKYSSSPKTERNGEIILTEENRQFIDLSARVQILSQQLQEKNDLVNFLLQKNKDTKKKTEQLIQENEELSDQVKKYINKTNIYSSQIIRQKNTLDQKDKELDQLQIKQSKIKKLLKIANKVKNTNTILQEKNRKLEQRILDSTLSMSTENKSNFNDVSDNNDDKGDVSKLLQKMMNDSQAKSQQIDDLSRKISHLGVSQRSLSHTVGQIQNQIVDSSINQIDDEINISD